MSKGLVAVCHSFWFIFLIFVHIRRGPFPSPHRLCAQWEKPHWGAEPRFELGPALQLADALPAGLRRTLTELRRTRKMYCASKTFLEC
jgi:hypothetical protein